ncbi:hypothetical protein DL93DRAFT_2095656 [Clavulina sp. PMI_390]|nr:hypothetical protein DL93DRAFT_2095656 [Clavulina sp. PMI_390]
MRPHSMQEFLSSPEDEPLSSQATTLRRRGHIRRPSPSAVLRAAPQKHQRAVSVPSASLTQKSMHLFIHPPSSYLDPFAPGPSKPKPKPSLHPIVTSELVSIPKMNSSTHRAALSKEHLPLDVPQQQSTSSTPTIATVTSTPIPRHPTPIPPPITLPVLAPIPSSSIIHPQPLAQQPQRSGSILARPETRRSIRGPRPMPSVSIGKTTIVPLSVAEAAAPVVIDSSTGPAVMASIPLAATSHMSSKARGKQSRGESLAWSSSPVTIWSQDSGMHTDGQPSRSTSVFITISSPSTENGFDPQMMLPELSGDSGANMLMTAGGDIVSTAMDTGIGQSLADGVVGSETQSYPLMTLPNDPAAVDWTVIQAYLRQNSGASDDFEDLHLGESSSSDDDTETASEDDSASTVSFTLTKSTPASSAQPTPNLRESRLFLSKPTENTEIVAADPDPEPVEPQPRTCVPVSPPSASRARRPSISASIRLQNSSPSTRYSGPWGRARQLASPTSLSPRDGNDAADHDALTTPDSDSPVFVPGRRSSMTVGELLMQRWAKAHAANPISTTERGRSTSMYSRLSVDDSEFTSPHRDTSTSSHVPLIF